VKFVSRLSTLAFVFPAPDETSLVYPICRSFEFSISLGTVLNENVVPIFIAIAFGTQKVFAEYPEF